MAPPTPPTDPLIAALESTPLSALLSTLLAWRTENPPPAILDAAALDALDAHFAGCLMRNADERNLDELKALLARWPNFEGADENPRFWRDWLDDLREWPGDLVALACATWRRRAHRKPPPTAGVLGESISPLIAHRRVIRRKLRQAREALNGGGAGAGGSELIDDAQRAEIGRGLRALVDELKRNAAAARGVRNW